MFNSVINIIFIKKPKWIPCSKHYPPEHDSPYMMGHRESDDVLVYEISAETGCGHVTIRQTVDGKWNVDERFVDVWAWMPLPEKYDPERMR